MTAGAQLTSFLHRNYWDEHLSVVNIGAFLILQIRNGCLDPATGLPVMLWHQGASTYGGLGHIVQGRTMSTGFTKVAPTVENWDERVRPSLRIVSCPLRSS